MDLITMAAKAFHIHVAGKNGSLFDTVVDAAGSADEAASIGVARWSLRNTSAGDVAWIDVLELPSRRLVMSIPVHLANTERRHG